MVDHLRFPPGISCPAPINGPDPLPLSGRMMLNRLVDASRTYSIDRKRVRRLKLMKDRHEGATKSEVVGTDRPEIELLLEHRDEAVELKAFIGATRRELLGIPKDEPGALERFARALGHLDSLEKKRLHHIAAMEKILEALSREQISRENLMAKLASDAAKLVQASVQHKDKMDLARENSEPSTEDLMAKMAAKYNIPVDQVVAMLSAKVVDVTDAHDA